MNLHLDDKLAHVTASTGGTGKEIGTSLATVIISGRTAAGVDGAMADIRAPRAARETREDWWRN
jgi:hypothetical protein